MICSIMDKLFIFCLFYALLMLEFCYSFDVEAYTSNLIISRC